MIRDTHRVMPHPDVDGRSNVTVIVELLIVEKLRASLLVQRVRSARIKKPSCRFTVQMVESVNLTATGKTLILRRDEG